MLCPLLATASWAQLPPPPSSPAPVVKLEYDAQGNPTRLVQAPGVTGMGFSTASSYDSLDRRKDSIDARSKTTNFEYNGRQDLIKVTDPRRLVTSYPRDGLGNVNPLSSPDTGAATLTYDAAGNLKTRTDSRGVLATYSYDGLNRLTSIVFTKSGSPSHTVTWTYDQEGAGFSFGVGRLTSTAYPGGGSTYGYDAQGRMTTHVQRPAGTRGLSGVVHTTGYEYDAAGHVRKIIYPSGRALNIAYAGGLPSSLALGESASASGQTLISAIQFEPFGAARSWLWQLGSGTQLHERSFDTYGRLVRYRLGAVVRDLRYDAADRIVSYTHLDAGTGAAVSVMDQDFSYDELGRLLSANANGAAWAFTYDDNGNRSTHTVNGQTRSYTTGNTSNWLLSLDNPFRQLVHDSAGNRTADTEAYNTATHDLTGRLASVLRSGVTTLYTLDASGMRVRKDSNSRTGERLIFVYDQGGHLLGEYAYTGAPVREYIWLGDTPVAMFTPGAQANSPPLVYYIHADHLDAPRPGAGPSGTAALALAGRALRVDTGRRESSRAWDIHPAAAAARTVL